MPALRIAQQGRLRWKRQWRRRHRQPSRYWRITWRKIYPYEWMYQRLGEVSWDLRAARCSAGSAVFLKQDLCSAEIIAYFRGPA